MITYIDKQSRNRISKRHPTLTFWRNHCENMINMLIITLMFTLYAATTWDAPREWASSQTGKPPWRTWRSRGRWAESWITAAWSPRRRRVNDVVSCGSSKSIHLVFWMWRAALLPSEAVLDWCVPPLCRSLLLPPPPPLPPPASRCTPLRDSPANAQTCLGTRDPRPPCQPRSPSASCPLTRASGTSTRCMSSCPLCQVGLPRSHWSVGLRLVRNTLHVDSLSISSFISLLCESVVLN